MTDYPDTDHTRLDLIADGPVLLSIDGGVARLTLNRPGSANGLSVEMLKAMHEAVMVCHSRADLRVLILRGAGANFCGGGDVKDFVSRGEGLPDYLREATAYLQVVSGSLVRLEAPVITGVQGYAAGGGGLGLVCVSDFVIAAASSKFLAGATRVGMAPDAGSSVTLQRLVGFRRAMDIVMRNPVISADEALHMGLITTVAADDQLDQVIDNLALTLAAGARRRSRRPSACSGTAWGSASRPAYPKRHGPSQNSHA
ncbi:enoyl-CoA hydratase/isomerase family protein [Brevundimonas abyssalis]|uniref:enoyl-CoA hydratase/isomerase family protein n=1 Tax=Brevundimonas abyssalis TaxID=1125965 RepID=UPI00190F8A2D|nr:enoyl-CoA hydratase/isomerase family protein [Brevundimonas abyssalis]